MERQTHTEIVEAPIAVCFDTIVDFDHYPEWFSGIHEASVLESDPQAGIWQVRYELHMVIKTISYTLAYQGKRPGLLSWKLLRGDVRGVEGSYEFTELEPAVTQAVCTQGVDVGFWLPGPLKRSFERSALADSVREFKKAAEARAASSS